MEYFFIPCFFHLLFNVQYVEDNCKVIPQPWQKQMGLWQLLYKNSCSFIALNIYLFVKNTIVKQEHPISTPLARKGRHENRTDIM